jgi:hypothetical protein
MLTPSPAMDAGVVLRDDYDYDREHEPHQGREVYVHCGYQRTVRQSQLLSAHQLVGDKIECDSSENGRAEHPLVQSTHDVLVLAKTDEEDGDHRSDDGDRTKNQGKYRGNCDVGEQQITEKHGRNCRDSICLEKVGCHSCTVADVVADIVRNGRRISGIILRDACLDLADQVCADISTFCEDPTSEARKDGYQTSSETESDECDDSVPRGASRSRQYRIEAGNRSQCEARNDHPGHGSALEREAQARRKATP